METYMKQQLLMTQDYQKSKIKLTMQKLLTPRSMLIMKNLFIVNIFCFKFCYEKYSKFYIMKKDIFYKIIFY